MLIEIASAALIVFGAGIALLGSVALARFPDIFTRLHGPTKATTVGIGSVLLGTVLYMQLQSGSGSVREVLITVFLFLTAPVSAHLIAKAALHRRCRSVCELPERD